MDSYHIYARLWGDAWDADERIPDGEAALEQSMQVYLSSWPKEIVSYMQLSDASRWSSPLSMDDPTFESPEVRDSRLLRSRIARPLPLEGLEYFRSLASRGRGRWSMDGTDGSA